MITTIILSIITILIALGIGLVLRRLLVRRLQKTVLDNWVVQTLGIVVIVLWLVAGSIAALSIWNLNLLWQFLITIKFDIRDAPSFIWDLTQTLLLIALGIGIARTVRAVTIRGLGESRIDINLRTLIGRIFYFVTLVFALFWILSIWQIPLTAPVTAISVLTVAVTVAIQDILKDLVAGFYILIERPFYIGDQISVTSNAITYTGKVEDVQLRAAKLRLLSGEEVTIPNALVFGSAVINNTYYGERRATISVTLPQEEFSKEQTPEQILQTLKECEGVMAKPEPALMFSGYAEEKITLTVHFWFASGQLSTVSDVMYTLHALLPNGELAVREPVGSV
jgi:small-conductance mechanosensitive channel